MGELWNKVVKSLAVVGGTVIGLLGGWTPLLTVLCSFMALDYLTGLAVAMRGRSQKSEGGGLSSTASFNGLLRKATILGVVMMAALLDHALGNSNVVFTTAAVCYYIVNEGLSILENVVRMGVPVPDAIRKALDMLAEKTSKSDDDAEDGIDGDLGGGGDDGANGDP